MINEFRGDTFLVVNFISETRILAMNLDDELEEKSCGLSPVWRIKEGIMPTLPLNIVVFT